MLIAQSAEVTPDQEQAEAQKRAGEHLLDAGAAELPRRPWLHPSQPPSSTDLIRFALWRAEQSPLTDDDVQATLALLPAARAEVEQAEAAVLFLARAQGLSWGRIARAMGLGSAQAALQRFDRITSRTAARDDA